MAAYAFRLDKERLGPLWTLPLQQFVYRQLMYRMERYGSLRVPQTQNQA